MPTAHFRIEVESLKSLESIFEPAGEGVPGANNCVIVEVEEDEPICKRFRHPQSSPRQADEPFSNRVKGFANIPAGSVEGASLCKGGLKCVDDLEVGRVGSSVG